MGVPLKVALPIWVMKTIIRNIKPGTWNPKSKSPNFFSGKSIITSMNIKGQVFHSTKIAHKHKSFSLYLNRFCHINDKILLFMNLRNNISAFFVYWEWHSGWRSQFELEALQTYIISFLKKRTTFRAFRGRFFSREQK